ncbi:hypothetical protein [Euzebya tangerina]|uniref:PIN-like domain-containing protein n=1 Tax=Euzebya tangerina TaxID=591198 RepID=UPI000E321286|nr:hypothetical protein [Euzebya tangerina]
MAYYFDASILGPAIAFARLRPDVIHPGHPECPPAISPSTPDDEWLPIAGREGWIVIMRDKKIRSRPGERRALLDHGVAAFCLTTSGNKSKWQMAQILMRHWERIEEVTAEVPRPFIYAVTQRDVRPIVPRS